MSTGETPSPIHPIPTQRRGLRDFFYDKHHGKDKTTAQWSVNGEIEFSVFDMADRHDLSNERGHLFGMGRNEEDEVLVLGTERQQVAEFPFARPGVAWHGYPVWPLSDLVAANRRKKGLTKQILDKIEDAGVINRAERRKLEKGDAI